MQVEYGAECPLGKEERLLALLLIADHPYSGHWVERAFVRGTSIRSVYRSIAMLMRASVLPSHLSGEENPYSFSK